jgi:rhomboid family GlyGly-CTERM serine protease
MKFRFPWLTLSLAAIAACLPLVSGAATALQFDRPTLAAGEWWRGLTAHLVHFNASHLTWDLLMLVILGAWAEQFSRRGLVLVLVVSAALISGAVWVFQPELATYRGLSGVDCALFGYVLAHALLRARQQRDRPMEVVTIAAGLLFVGKTFFEFASGQTVFAETHDAFVPVPLAHLIGFGAGLLAGTAARIPRPARQYPPNLAASGQPAPEALT